MPVTQITFGLVPHVEDAATRESLELLCSLISSDTGLDVRPLRAGSPALLANAVAADKVQIAWISPTLLLLSEALRNVVPLLTSVRQGVDAYHGLLFVAEDSPIRSWSDLIGKRVAWVARTSASGYLVPRLALKRRGLDVSSMFSSEVFLNSHGAVSWAVHDGSADVAATYGMFERGDPALPLVKSGYREFLPEFRGRVIESAGPIPSDMIVAHPAVPMLTRASIAGALSRLAVDDLGGPSIRKLIGADTFRPFSHESLRALQDLVEVSRS